MNTFDETVFNLIKKFPLCVNWLEWWLRPETKQMIFKPFMKMNDKLQSEVPNTTNAQESMHFVFYQIGDYNNSICQGLTLLVLFAQCLESKFSDISSGRTTIRLFVL